jgi:hypothetical protein
VHWAQFCTMVTNRFSTHSSHTSLKLFHHLKQSTSITNYIQKFKDMMSLMQMDYPGVTEPYFISSFIARMTDGIKHYLIPHCPQTLCETYSKAKELEKGILVKKSLLSCSNTYPKTSSNYTPAKQITTTQAIPQP